MADTELKDCPFCGGAVELERTTGAYEKMHGQREWWGVVCRNTVNVGGTCAIQQVPSASKEAAVERWNRRSTSSVSEGEMPGLPIMANGRPVEHAQMDWVCRFINENSVFDGDDILQAWNALVAFYVANRAATKAAAGADAHSPDCGNQGCTGCIDADDLARQLAPAEDARAENNKASVIAGLGSMCCHIDRCESLHSAPISRERQAAEDAREEVQDDMQAAFVDWLSSRGPLGSGALSERIFYAGWLAARRTSSVPAIPGAATIHKPNELE